MKIISLFTKALHLLPSEFSHNVAMRGLKFIHIIGLLKLLNLEIKNHSEKNNKDLRLLSKKIGLAAGLDKNGDYIDCLAALGLHFIEVGTVTPRPQTGNPKPRIFRNKKDKSILNRLGFNNKGVDHLVKNLKRRKSDIIVGSSIGRNFDTSNEYAVNDYLYCLERVYRYSDYIAVNISSPNSKGLRELGNQKYLNSLLQNIKSEQDRLTKIHKYVPIFIKISPDETEDNLKIICDSVVQSKLDGIICSNTTVEHNHEKGHGGVSGAPLKNKSTACLKYIKKLVKNNLTIIASGGVMSAEDFQEKIKAGADHVQIYTGFIYEGPKLISDIVKLG